MKNKKNKNCVMCGEEPELLEDPNTQKYYIRYFIAPQTKEALCNKCNIINDKIAFEKGSSLKGEQIIEENETI